MLDVRRMERKRKVGIAAVLLSFPVGLVSMDFLFDQAANGTRYALSPWVGIVSAVLLYFVGLHFGAPERQDRW